VLELSGRISTSSENGSSVSVPASIDQVNTLLESTGSDDTKDRSKDLIIISSSAGFTVVDNSGTYEIALFEAGDFDSSSV
jgi:hypothetical protein